MLHFKNTSRREIWFFHLYWHWQRNHSGHGQESWGREGQGFAEVTGWRAFLSTPTDQSQGSRGKLLSKSASGREFSTIWVTRLFRHHYHWCFKRFPVCSRMRLTLSVESLSNKIKSLENLKVRSKLRNLLIAYSEIICQQFSRLINSFSSFI